MINSKELAHLSRVSIIEMITASKAAHIGSSLSVIDILSVIVTEATLAQNAELGDEIIISKGHAAAGTYAVLAHAGYIPIDLLDTYSLDGSLLGGHVTSRNVPVINLSTGSLGHGLPFSIGRALAKKRLGVINIKVSLMMYLGND